MMSILATLLCSSSERFPNRWFYMQTNLAVEENVLKVIHTMDRAKEAGYNAMVITDSKFSILDLMGPEYFAKVKRVRDKAAAFNISVIPCVADMGWSSGLLAHDVNLIEGQPVRKAAFIAENGVLKPLYEVDYANGGMEDVSNHRLKGFSFQDAPGTSTVSDTDIKHGGSRSVRFESFRADNQAGNSRIMHSLDIKPWNQYRIQFWLKTEGVKNPGDIRCFAMGEGGKVLSFMDVGAKATQDWTQHTIIFNSQDFKKVTIYAGIWGGVTGKFWIDDVSVREAGFLNVLRRPGTPVRLLTEDGTTLTEGKDYEVISDPNLGKKPWAGEYTFDHAAPQIKVFTDDGIKILASYSHAVATESGKTAICPSEPKSMEVVADQIRRVVDLWKPKSLFLAHDEIRVANQCPLCASRNMTPGQIYAENLRQCVGLAKKAIPGGNIYVWSDMFDPSHNAVDNYYLSNGSWQESWKGLSPDVTVVNWNSGNAAKSLPFFAGLGCKQILAGYYDAPVTEMTKWLNIANGLKGLDGVMYTTWTGDYTRMEEFAGLAFRSN